MARTSFRCTGSLRGHLVHGLRFAGFGSGLFRRLLGEDRPASGKTPAPRLHSGQPAQKTTFGAAAGRRRCRSHHLIRRLRRKPHCSPQSVQENFLLRSALCFSAWRTSRLFPLWSNAPSRRSSHAAPGRVLRCLHNAAFAGCVARMRRLCSSSLSPVSRRRRNRPRRRLRGHSLLPGHERRSAAPGNRTQHFVPPGNHTARRGGNRTTRPARQHARPSRIAAAASANRTPMESRDIRADLPQSRTSERCVAEGGGGASLHCRNFRGQRSKSVAGAAKDHAGVSTEITGVSASAPLCSHMRDRNPRCRKLPGSAAAYAFERTPPELWLRPLFSCDVRRTCGPLFEQPFIECKVRSHV